MEARRDPGRIHSRRPGLYLCLRLRLRSSTCPPAAVSVNPVPTLEEVEMSSPKPTRPVLPMVAILALAGGSACAGDGPARALPEPTVTDSAGVRVVDNRLPAGPLPAWAVVAPEPTWTLNPGGIPVRPGLTVDVRGAATLSDGRVALADAGTFRVRYFREGQEVWSMGGRGTGVGRFQGIAGLGLGAGDTVWVSDHRAHELTLVDPAGEESLEGTLPVEGAVVGRFGDGSFLAIRVRSPEEGRPLGVSRDSADYLRWWPVTGDTARLGTFPAGQVLTLETEEQGRIALPPPLGRQTSVAVGPGRVYVGDQDRFEILGYDPDGSLRQVVRLEGVDRTVTDELLSTLSVVDRTGQVPSWAERFWSHTPEALPAFGRILLDGRANLWVSEPQVAAVAPRTWWVFSPEGVLQGRVDVPEGLTVLELGASHLLGLVERPGGGQELRRYALEMRGR